MRWGKGYFSVADNGHLLVHPNRDPAASIDLKLLVERLEERGVVLPILLRFSGILEDRIAAIQAAFQHSMTAYQYLGDYSLIYPVKVNPQRHVVEQVVAYGRSRGIGLEVGSKPELLAVVAMTDVDVPVLCNGFKDSEFIELAMMAQKMGRQVIPVIEKYSDLDLILRHAETGGRAPADWRTSETRGSRFGTLADFGRLSLEIRSDCQ